jgi:SAM-dependent methyltransferase
MRSTTSIEKIESVVICPGCLCELLIDYDQCLIYRTEQNALSTMPTHIVTCNQCEIKFAIPRFSPTEIDQLYKKGGFWKTHSKNIFTAQKAPGQFMQSSIRWRYIIQNSENKVFDILDVGAGYGFIGQAAYHTPRRRLNSYTVVEKDEYFLESLQMTWDQNFPQIKFKAYSDLTHVEGKFNIIVLSHVLEHVVNPRDYLRQVNNLLDRKGILYIEVPFLDYQYKGDFFPHLLFFDPQSLRNLCESSGFRVISVRSFGKSKEKSPINYKNQKRIDVRLFNLFKDASRDRSKVKNENIRLVSGNKGKIKSRLLELVALINRKRLFKKFAPWKTYGKIISFYYGFKKQKIDGTWIRLIASK